MRRAMRSIMIIVAAAFVAGFLMSEVWRLIGSRHRGGPQSRAGLAGRFGREAIPLEQYRQMRDYVSRKYQRDSCLRDLTTDDEARIDQLAWDRLITELNWARVLRQTKLRVTEGEIQWIIMHTPPAGLAQRPELMTDGQFDTAKYYELLRNPQNQGYFASYARDIYEQLRQQKLQLYILAADRITPAQVDDIQRKLQTTVAVTALYFGPGLTQDSAAAEPTEQEARAWYRSHPDQFRSQKEIREVRYLRIPLPITGQDSLDARQRIELAWQRINSADTASFRDSVEMAMLTDGDYEPDTTSQAVPRDQLDSTTKALWTRPLGPSAPRAFPRFTRPYPTPSGWQITILDSVREDTAYIRRIRTRIKPDPNRDIQALDQARSLIEQAQVAGLDSVAAANNLIPPPFPLTMVGGELVRSPINLYTPAQLTDWARTARKGEVMSTPLRAPDGLNIFQLSNIVPAGIRPYDRQVAQTAKWRIKQERDRQRWTNAARQALEELRGGKTLEQLAAENPGLQLSRDTVHGLNDYQARATKPIEFIAAALALDPGQTYGPVATNYGTYIIRCDAVTQTQPQQVDEYLQQLRQGTAEALWESIWQQPEISDYRPTNYQ